MARTGGTWTCSTPSGIRPEKGRRGVGAVPVLGQVLGGPVVVQRQLRCSWGAVH